MPPTPDDERPSSAEVEEPAPAPEGETPEGAETVETTEAPPELPDDIEHTEEAELRALYDALGEAHAARRESARTPDDVAVLRTIRERQNAIATELGRRVEEERAVLTELEALDAETAPPLPESNVPAMATMTAAQAARLRGQQPRPAQQPTPETPARPRVAMLAAAGAELVPTGNAITLTQIGQEWDRRKRGAGGSAILASLPAFENMNDFPLDEILHIDHGVTHNDRLILEAQDAWRMRRRGEQVPARMAAICGPLDYIREIPDAFNSSEPVSGIFPSRPAGHLGYQFTPSLNLADVLSGSTIWSDTNQASVDPTNSATWKPCVTVACPNQSSVRAEAATACLLFDITTEMSNPERIRNATNAVLAAKARNKEARVLQLIDSLSYFYSFYNDVYGALPTIIEACNTAIAQATFGNRLDAPDYTLIIPPALLQLATIDRSARAYGVEQEVSDVLAYLRASIPGVSEIVQTLDESLGGDPGIPFSAFPTVGPANGIPLPWISCQIYRLRLVAPEAALYSETGEVNVGVGRQDTNLQRQNRAMYFTEDFFMLSKSGPQPWFGIDIELDASGARAGLVAPVGCKS